MRRTAASVAPICTLATLCACLVACSTAPPAGAPAPAPAPDATRAAPPTRADESAAAFEQQQLARAAALEHQGLYVEAVFAWQVLALLRPEHGERLAELNKRVATLASERLQRARQAQAKGDLPATEQAYLSVLALQSDHAEAAASLRSIERNRMRRDLGQPSRIILARRPSEYAVSKPGTSAGDPLELEQVSMLAGQGEMDDAIGMLERRLAAQPRDDAARRLLASLYFRRAQSLQTSNPIGARAALASCLRLAPGHADAAALLKQLTPPTTKPPAARAKPAPRVEGPR